MLQDISPAQKLFEVCIGTVTGKNIHRIAAPSSMDAFQKALHMMAESGSLRSLVVRPVR